MIALIYKDLYLARKILIQILVICGVFAIIGAINAAKGDISLIETFMYVYGFMTVYSIIDRILYYEDHYKGVYFMRTLPIKESAIVTNKFIVGLILITFSGIILLSFTFLLHMALPNNLSQKEIMFLILILGVNLIYCAIYLAMYFFVGYAKARQYVIGILMVLMLTPAVIGMIAQEWMLKALNFLFATPYIPPVVLIIGIGIYAICWTISIHAFKHESQKAA